jgi:hypothetical protein
VGTVVGVVIGYALGARSGQKEWAEISEAWKVIRASDEVKDLIAGGFALLRELLRRGSALLAGSREQGDNRSVLRSVA